MIPLRGPRNRQRTLIIIAIIRCLAPFRVSSRIRSGPLFLLLIPAYARGIKQRVHIRRRHMLREWCHGDKHLEVLQKGEDLESGSIV